MHRLAGDAEGGGDAFPGPALGARGGDLQRLELVEQLPQRPTAANPIAGSSCAAAAASWVASLILSVWLAAQLDAGRVFASDLPDLGSGLNELNAAYRRRQPTRRLHS